MTNTNNTKKLRWAIRRGMRELDLILENFLEHYYCALSKANQHYFTELLLCTDPELENWLLRKQLPPEKFQAIIANINHSISTLVFVDKDNKNKLNINNNLSKGKP